MVPWMIVVAGYLAVGLTLVFVGPAARLRRREQEKLEWQAYDQPRWKLIAFSYAIALGIIILWPVLTVSAARTEAASKVEFDLLQPRSVEPSAALDRWVADIQNRYTNALPFEDYREISSKLPWSNAGIDVEAAQRSHQLEVALPQDTYLQTGRFNKDAMLELVQKVLREGAALGFPLTRLIAHAETAIDNWTSSNDWVEYEMRLNDVLPNYADPVICTYDVNLLNSSLAIDILRTHPVAVIGGVLVENKFFSRPDDFLREVRERTSPPQAYRG